MRKALVLMIILALLGVTTLACTRDRAVNRTSEAEEFPTGFVVRGLFNDFYNSVDDPLLIFGYPISNEFTDNFGNRAQFFQKAKFILRKNAKNVELVNLGFIFLDKGEPVSLDLQSATCRQMENPGIGQFAVCHAFLNFYERHDGEWLFGKPLAPVTLSNGRLVQYFDNVCMEYVPDDPLREYIHLRDLGSLQMRRDSPPEMSPGISANPRLAQVRAFVSDAIVEAGSQQTLYVVVQDSFSRPIPQAMAQAVVVYADGRTERLDLSNSDADGISKFSFQVTDGEPRQAVTILVRVTHRGSVQETSTWFRIWW